MTPTVVFIISLARSGSTLLQKLLMSHNDIRSIGEPWLILPLVYSYKKTGVKAEYGHITSVEAKEYLFQQLPNGKDDYISEIRNFALNIYSKLADNAKYFIDKTPRNFLIIPELRQIFPEAKFVFLLRNPISVYASYIEAFNDNSIRRMGKYNTDLIGAPQLIANGVKDVRDHLVLRYEDLVTKPHPSIENILAFLGLDNDKKLISNFFDNQIIGLGDHLGARTFWSIKDQREKWKTILNSHLRIVMAINYIKNVSSDYLKLGGYDRNIMLKELSELKPRAFSLAEHVWYLEDTIIRKIPSLKDR